MIIKQREYTERKVEGKHLHSHLYFKGADLKSDYSAEMIDNLLNWILNILILRRKIDQYLKSYEY